MNNYNLKFIAENLIETFNETNDEDLEVNTTDLGYKFTELKDYVEDYS